MSDPSDLAERLAICEAALLAQSQTNAELIERLAEAGELIAQLQQSHADAWVLIGRCDMAFEQITAARLLDHRKRIAKQMRDEIKKASGG